MGQISHCFDLSWCFKVFSELAKEFRGNETKSDIWKYLLETNILQSLAGEKTKKKYVNNYKIVNNFPFCL